MKFSKDAREARLGNYKYAISIEGKYGYLLYDCVDKAEKLANLHNIKLQTVYERNSYNNGWISEDFKEYKKRYNNNETRSGQDRNFNTEIRRK